MFSPVRNRKPFGTIRIAAWAQPHEEHAAEELARSIAKITGAEMSIQKGLHKTEEHDFVIADVSHPAIGKLLPSKIAEGLRHDGVRILTEKKRLYIVSGQASGVVHGIYVYLREFLGCAFNDFGLRGQDIPSLDTIEHKEIDHLDNPRCWYRGMQSNAFLEKECLEERLDWMAQNGFNYLMSEHSNIYDPGLDWLAPMLKKRGLRWAFGHHSFAALLPAEVFLEERPDFFSLQDGKRVKTGQLDWCLSNEELHATIARQAIELVRRYPDIDVIEFWPDDGIRPTCSCRECAAIPQKRDIEQTDLSRAHGAKDAKGNVREDAHGGLRGKMRQYLHVANGVARRLKEVYPRVRLNVIAYGDLTQPPAGEFELESNILVSLATYWRCSRHDLFDPACSINRQYADIIREWTDALPPERLYLYSYEMGMGCWSSLPYPLIRKTFREWDRLAGMGVAGTHIQSYKKNQGVYGMNYLAVARALREKHPGCDKFIRNYCNEFFGAAAKPMRDLFVLWEDCMENGPAEHIRPTPLLCLKNLFSGQAVELSRKLCGEALARATDPRHRWRIERVGALVEYIALWRKMPEAHLKIMTKQPVSRKEKAQSIQWLNQCRDFVSAHLDLDDDIFLRNFAERMLTKWLEQI